ncbi:MAG: phosphate signaling complex protein PhoU [Pseudomonadota bacterium]
MRSNKDGDLTLDIALSQMAALVESNLAGAIEAFERRDIANAEALIAADKRVDDLHSTIELQVMAALAEGPFDALRLREIMMIMKVSGELERVGDLAKNVAKRTLVVSREKFVKPSMGVNRMGRSALRQFSHILNAYSSRNLAAAKAVWGGDDELDELYNSVFKEIIVNMMEDGKRVNACTQMVFIAKNFERVGDHATNIAEALHYFITGEPLAEERPKGDDTSVTKVAPPVSDT